MSNIKSIMKSSPIQFVFMASAFFNLSSWHQPFLICLHGRPGEAMPADGDYPTGEEDEDGDVRSFSFSFLFSLIFMEM